MGCFLACFGKDQRRRKQGKRLLPRDQLLRNGSYRPGQLPIVSLNQEKTEVRISPVKEIQIRDEVGEQTSFGNRKKVTFNSNVKTYDPVEAHEVTDYAPEKVDIVEEKRKEKSLAKPSHSPEDGSITSSMVSYPPNHRYQNCRDSDDEIEESDYGGSDLEDDDLEEDNYDEDDDDRVEDGDGLSDSLSSMESRTRISEVKVTTTEVDSFIPVRGVPDKERNARDRSGYVHSVLNPVENLTQWKAVKSRGTSTLKHQKENFALEEEPPRISFSMEPNLKQSSFSSKSKSEQPKHQSQDIAVDASLSNWLVSSELTPKSKNSTVSFATFTPEKSMSQGSNSPMSLEDRPILGALTVEELKQFSASSSPRKSPSRSPDDMPIIGTVGTYWNREGLDKDFGSVSSYKGIPNTTSKYREDKRVNWHSTPFETRLERALNRGAAGESKI